jgi:putative ABC transport system permease protein
VLDPWEPALIDEVRTPFMVLMAAVACVLLIACFNVGGLQMERTLARRREMALRLALGAGRARLARQMLTENVLLSLAGAAGGVIAAKLALPVVVAMLPGYVPYLDQIGVNLRVLAAAIGVAAVAGIIAGLLPVAETRWVDPVRDLGGASRGSERRGSLGRRALVVLEIALSITVLIGAALMVQTFLTLRPTNPGFDASHKVVMHVRVRGAGSEESQQFFTQLFARLRAVPSIRAAEGSTYVPLSGSSAFGGLAINGTMANVQMNYTTPGFFTLLKVPIVAGRAFTAADTRASLPVILVNEALAVRIRPDGQVVGERVLVRSESGPAGAAPMERIVVGVLANMRNSGVDTRPRSEAYIPYAQNPGNLLRIVAEALPGREAEAGQQMRAAVRALRPDLVVPPLQSLTAINYQRLGTAPLGAWLLGVIAVLAVGLAAIGLMTTIGWWVRQRTRELGVRVALGASRAGVTRLVLRQGMTLAAIGVALGCAVAAGVTRFLTGWIYGVTPLDPATFTGAAIGMLVIAAIAVYVPVRRATAVDPVVALRAE